MTELDMGYKCSTCGESFTISTSAKQHAFSSKRCWIGGQVPNVVPYRIHSRGSDRRVGGIESIDIPINQRERNENVSNHRDQQDFDAAPDNFNENDMVDHARRNRSGMFP